MAGCSSLANVDTYYSVILLITSVDFSPTEKHIEILGYKDDH